MVSKECTEPASSPRGSRVVMTECSAMPGLSCDMRENGVVVFLYVICLRTQGTLAS
jgi:hypothetical protein